MNLKQFLRRFQRNFRSSFQFNVGFSRTLLKFKQNRIWRLLSSKTWCHVVKYKFADVSEEGIASCLRFKLCLASSEQEASTIYSTLNVLTVLSSETSANSCRTTWRHIQEDGALYSQLITVTARYKAWTFFARSNAEIVGSNTIQGMDVCVRLFCVYVVLCVGSGLVKG
jgi:hypothetical protein